MEIKDLDMSKISILTEEGNTSMSFGTTMGRRENGRKLTEEEKKEFLKNIKGE